MEVKALFLHSITKNKMMTTLVLVAQIIVAASVFYVWIFRYDVIIKEFKQFGLSDLTRTFCRSSKDFRSNFISRRNLVSCLSCDSRNFDGIIYGSRTILSFQN